MLKSFVDIVHSERGFQVGVVNVQERSWQPQFLLLDLEEAWTRAEAMAADLGLLFEPHFEIDVEHEVLGL